MTFLGHYGCHGLQKCKQKVNKLSTHYFYGEGGLIQSMKVDRPVTAVASHERLFHSTIV